MCEGYSLSGSIHKDDASADIGVDISDGGKGIIRWSEGIIFQIVEEDRERFYPSA